MEQVRKDFVIAAALYLVLTILFSLNGPPGETFSIPVGNVPKYPGDSGQVLSGKGSDPAEMILSEPLQPETEETKESSIANESKTKTIEVTEEVTTENEEKKSMDNILLAFWHGVATVLIGETVALMVCIAWMKIKGDKDG